MIASGELFYLGAETCGELHPLQAFLNQNVRVLTAALDRCYVAVEPTTPGGAEEGPRRSVWCFQGDSDEPTLCPEFDTIEEGIRQIAIGEQHLLVLTADGAVYSRGQPVYGNVGHGGASEVPDFKRVPTLRDCVVKFVAAGPFFSVAVTDKGDVYSWGQAFKGETGLFTSVETVPRFAPLVTPFRVAEVSCGNAHVLARTESQQCVAWGENTCGQLGVGHKCKPNYRPTLLETIPSQVCRVSAGWAHSVAVGSDGRAYAWGLNSHGQLGLGDTKTRFAPHLVDSLARSQEVVSAHAARTFTLFGTVDCRAVLCGQVPRRIGANGCQQPAGCSSPGCLLLPVPLTVASDAGAAGSGMSQISQLVAFDKGALCFARSTVFRAEPNVAPVTGGTQVRALVTGLPFDRPEAEGLRSPLAQDLLSVKVHLYSATPHCDMVVDGRIVDVGTVEFATPSVEKTPLGAMVEQGTLTAVQLRVSIDGGITWTPDRYEPPSVDARSVARSESRATLSSTAVAPSMPASALRFCRWPREGPTHVEPNCVPVTGGTELLLHVALPAGMPPEALSVRFVRKLNPAAIAEQTEGRALMRRGSSDMLARQMTLGPSEVSVRAWLDPQGRGVRCLSPALSPGSVRTCEYFVELSLDGRQFLPRTLPLRVFDARVSGLRPNRGPLLEPTEVRIQTNGLVRSDIMKVRLDFPRELQWPSRILPASYDYVTEEIFFAMPELMQEVRERVDQAREAAAQQQAEAEAAAPVDEAAPPPEAPPVDPDGGLAGLQVFVELSLNAQNFTEDRVCFTYYGSNEPDALPEGTSQDGAKLP